jgi:hypothetical protein
MLYLFVLALLICPGKVTSSPESDGGRSWVFRPLWLVLLLDAADWAARRQATKPAKPCLLNGSERGAAAVEK